MVWTERESEHQYSDQCSNRIRAPCVVSTAVGTKGLDDQMARLSAYREQLTEEGREAGRLLMKREKSTGPRTEHLDGFQTDDFCDFDKPRKRTYQKGKIESNEQGSR